jgi:hypothetical protein
MAEEGKRSLSTYLGCGCAALVGLFMLFMVSITWMTYRASQSLKDMSQDPERAAAAVQEVLPYRELPPGYHAVGNMSVPFLMDVAFLGGPGEPGAADGFEHGFLFVRIRDWFHRGERSRKWIEGGEGDDSPIEQQELSFEPQELVARGELRSDGADVVWSARRGDVHVDSSVFAEGKGGVNFSFGDGEGDEKDDGDAKAEAEAEPGVLTLMSITCPDDDFERVAIWFVPDPAPGTASEEVDWTGTPADAAAVGEMLGRFEICR